MFTPKSKQRATKLAERGKEAEEQVREILTEFAKHSKFDFERNYDARSAKGMSYARRCGDFTWYGPASHGVIEVKETKNKASLPYKNFESHQVGKLTRRQLAGGVAFVVIHCTTDDTWVMSTIDRFRDRPDTAASWDLSDLTRYNTCRELPIFDFIFACIYP